MFKTTAPNHFLRTSSLLASAIAATILSMPSHAADVFTEALKGGKAVIQIRPRLELVEQDTPTADNATALTVRSVVGYETAPIEGIKAYVEFEDIRAIVDNYSVPVMQPNAKYAVVVDPKLTDINQAYLSGYGAKLGRQKIVVDNARFIGDVAWRQNDQVFDALSYQTKTLAPWLDLQVAYATQVAMINGQSGDIRLPLINAKIKTPVGANVSLFWAGLEGREKLGQLALQQNVQTDRSRQYASIHIDGKADKILYDVAYAQQQKYADGTKVFAPDADYYSVMLGYDFGKAKLSVQQESLESGFATPLATLHIFNGWADKFLTTPTAGLVDTNIKLSGAYAGFNLAAALHRFESDIGSTHYGDEINLSAGRKLNPNMTGLLKLAHYQGGDDATTPAALKQDLSKLWLQVDYKF